MIKSWRSFDKDLQNVVGSCVAFNKRWRLTHQHVLSQPALLLCKAGGDPQCKALLPQEGISTVATTKGHNLPLVWDMGHEGELGVTGPVVNQWLCGRRSPFINSEYHQ